MPTLGFKGDGSQGSNSAKQVRFSESETQQQEDASKTEEVSLIIGKKGGAKKPTKKPAILSQKKGKGPTPEKGKGPALEKGNDPALEKGTGPDLEKGKGPALEKGKGPTPEKGKGPTLEKGKDPALEKGKDPAMEKGKAPVLEKRTGPAPEKGKAQALGAHDGRTPSKKSSNKNVAQTEGLAFIWIFLVACVFCSFFMLVNTFML